jgi:hypothetical protein
MCESDSITDRLVIPFAEAREIVGGANRLYLRPCPCRVSARQCPADTWEVCLLFENAPQADLHAAWAITQAEALAVLQASAERGETHNLFFRHTTRSITELCNCCHSSLQTRKRVGEGRQPGQPAAPSTPWARQPAKRPAPESPRRATDARG